MIIYEPLYNVINNPAYALFFQNTYCDVTRFYGSPVSLTLNNVQKYGYRDGLHSAVSSKHFVDDCRGAIADAFSGTGVFLEIAHNYNEIQPRPNRLILNFCLASLLKYKDRGLPVTNDKKHMEDFIHKIPPQGRGQWEYDGR